MLEGVSCGGDLGWGGAGRVDGGGWSRCKLCHVFVKRVLHLTNNIDNTYLDTDEREVRKGAIRVRVIYGLSFIQGLGLGSQGFKMRISVLVHQ